MKKGVDRLAEHLGELKGERMMTDDNTNAQAQYQTSKPNPDLKSLAKLVGTWKISGGAEGKATYEWMEGGFFLIQHVDLEQYGQKIKGFEVIGHLKPFGEEPSENIKSRFFDTIGNTLDYVYELKGNTLMIWGLEQLTKTFTYAILISMVDARKDASLTCFVR
jgi:hypothetical protein